MAHSDSTCILETVSKSSGPTKTFKATGIETLIRSAVKRGDEEIRLKIIETSHSSITIHQSCYCTHNQGKNY